MSKGPISQFIEKYYLHFNSATVVDAAKAYEQQLEKGAKMMVTLAGAMSTAEIGKIFAEMIRKDKVQIVSCTGANLEEDIMNLVAHSHYERVPNYRDLTPQEEWDLMERGLNRVTDTCIPEHEAFRRLQKHIYKIWKDADDNGERYFPHEFMYKLLLSGVLEEYYEIQYNVWDNEAFHGSFDHNVDNDLESFKDRVLEDNNDGTLKKYLTLKEQVMLVHL